MNIEKSVLIVLPKRDFREEEYFTPKELLEEAGISVKVASSTAGECFGVEGKLAEADFDFSQVISTDFCAVIFIGGPGTETLFNDQAVLGLAKEFFEAGKIVAAICWAPVILAKAGLLQGKRATVWDGDKGEIIAGGGIYTGEKITVDGNIVTGNGPDASEDFGNKLVEILAE